MDTKDQIILIGYYGYHGALGTIWNDTILSYILQNSIIKLLKKKKKKKKKKKTQYLLDGNVMQYVIKVQTHVCTFMLLWS